MTMISFFIRSIVSWICLYARHPWYDSDCHRDVKTERYILRLVDHYVCISPYVILQISQWSKLRVLVSFLVPIHQAKHIKHKGVFSNDQKVCLWYHILTFFGYSIQKGGEWTSFLAPSEELNELLCYRGRRRRDERNHILAWQLDPRS